MKALALALLSVSAFGQMLPGPGGNVTVSSSTTARLFNGSSDQLTNSTCYLNVLQAGTSPFTISLWFKSAGLTQTNTYAMLDNVSGNQVALIYGFVNDGSGHAQLELFVTGGTGGNFRTGSQITILDTNWHHIVYRYDGTTEYDLFLDGSKTVINASFTGTLPNGSCTSFTLGSGGGGSYVNASIARVLISNAAITDGQVAALAGATCSSSGVSGTQGYWLINGSSPEPEHSPSPNTNSLTVTGTTTTTGPTCSSS